MKTLIPLIGPPVLTLLMLASFVTSTVAQQASEVSIPDPGLNAAIREALQKPSGPLTEQDLLGLTILSASDRNIRSLEGLAAARNLSILDLDSNSFTNVTALTTLTNLTILDLFDNHLTDFVLSTALPKLTALDIGFNSLVHCSLPGGLTNLDTLFLDGNSLTNFSLPAGLAALTELDLSGNELTNVTLPPDMTNLNPPALSGNPLATFVLSEPLAATNLAVTVADLRQQGVSVATYPLVVQLTGPRRTAGGDFVFAVVGPPGVYAFLGSTNLAAWSELGIATNQVGFARFSDAAAALSPQKFYRALMLGAPTNIGNR